MSEVDWSRGYPVSETYPPSWHSFQSPAHLQVVCALMGVAWDVGPDTPMNILEIGCGTGYTSLMLAAGNPKAQVLGLDYNPAHIAEARAMAAEAGLANAHFIDADLAEMSTAEVRALPEFDLITVHGVWSWVGDPVREGVLRVIRQRLRAGGLVMMGYNALPGAAGSLGLARLVRKCMLGAAGSELGVAAASKLVERLVAAEPAHLPPSAWRRLLTGEVPGARPGYMLHEFQTEFWRPAFQADVAAALATARCEYLGSATIDENFPQLSLSAAQRVLWEEAPDSAGRELLFDVFVPRAFRRDVYARGLRRVPRDAAVDALWLATAVHTYSAVKLRSQAGEAMLPPAMVHAVRAALLEGPKTVGALRALPACAKATSAELLAMLVEADVAVPLWRAPGRGADWGGELAASRRLNAVAARRFAPHGVGAGQYGLATPALGGGLTVPPMELAVANLAAQAGAAVRGPQNAEIIVQGLLPPGSEQTDETMAQVRKIVAALLAERLPVWQALGIA